MVNNAKALLNNERENNPGIWYRRFGQPDQVLSLDNEALPPLSPQTVRVRMRYAPVNASDLIPITGAYGHRVVPPLVAGYEGVGVVAQAPADYASLIGQRVLALRGSGTWQRWVDCPASLAVPVPDWVADPLAARAYINPLAALLMLRQHPPGGRRVLLTAAASDCGILLGQWAQRRGAATVAGIYRSPIHARRLMQCGITPVSQGDSGAVARLAAESDLVFDATGGGLAAQILEALPPSAHFICYGLLSGQSFRQQRPRPQVHWFHMRNYLDEFDSGQWQALFAEIWPLLEASQVSAVKVFAAQEWRQAINAYHMPGRAFRPLLDLSAL